MVRRLGPLSLRVARRRAFCVARAISRIACIVKDAADSDVLLVIDGTIEAWRNRPIEGEHPYVLTALVDDNDLVFGVWPDQNGRPDFMVVKGGQTRQFAAGARPSPRSTRRSGA